MMNRKSVIGEPSIISANCYTWVPNSNASGRRWAEKRRQNEVFIWLDDLGFDTHISGDIVFGERDNLRVEFQYSESCRNVYKHFRVYRDGKKSNITTIRKLYPALEKGRD